MLSLAMLAGCEAVDAPPPRVGEAEQLACTPYVPLNGAAKITIANAPDVAWVADRSLVITSRDGYAGLVAPFTLGRLLQDVGGFINYHLCTDRTGSKDIPTFIRAPFSVGADDVDAHNVWTGVKVGSVKTIRNAFRTQILGDAWPDGDGDGPFRLLAVVDRLDVAGDVDLRGGGQFAGADRRWFGEARLVFGLSHDLDHGATPYPMTLIMEYRLPALKETVTGKTTTYELDPTFDPTAGPDSDAAWRAGRARWAKIWRELSRYAPTDPQYQALLLDIVKLFATGDNHVALRTGEQTYDVDHSKLTNEYEYREFYLNDGWNLSTRKLRREPILCAQGSKALKGRIEGEWSDYTSDLHFTYMMGDRQLDSDDVDELSNLCGGGKYESPDGMPYGQDLLKPAGTSGLRAKFTRFSPTTVWQLANETELKRHRMAAGACSGCHAGETHNPAGFHIFPRLAGADSKLSPMLRGKVTVNPNGTPYTLDELADRTAKLTQFAASHDYTDDYNSGAQHEDLFCNATPCSATTYKDQLPAPGL